MEDTIETLNDSTRVPERSETSNEREGKKRKGKDKEAKSSMKCQSIERMGKKRWSSSLGTCHCRLCEQAHLCDTVPVVITWQTQVISTLSITTSPIC